ncbi:MAG: trypsin-like peptidase domain-containing protein [Chloroflexi bacterium]|nr:trypsin-like peptidase domain-containing protein [Chloroflexota bacterium]
MSVLTDQLNVELAAVVERMGRSLVQVRNGRRGAGAGTIWHPDGLVVTNAHVASGSHLSVVLPNGTSLPARILVSGPDLDLAALMVDATGLPAVAVGDSRKLQPGQWVLAMGHPWGVLGAGATGVVIGVGPDLPGIPQFQHEWVVVDLRLRPGNSGGPLIDGQGRLVGVNTMIVGPNVGMAVPAHVVKAFLRKALLELGRSASPSVEGPVRCRL